MEGRLSGIPRRVGGRSSSAGNDRSSFAPFVPHGNAPGSSRLSRPMSKLSMIDPGKKTNTGRLSRSSAMSPITPLNVKSIPFPRLTETPSTALRTRTPSVERRRNWKVVVERAMAGTTLKDRRPIGDTAWQRAQLNRLQNYFTEQGTDCDQGTGFVQTPIQRPLTIARFVDLVSQLLAPLTKNQIDIKNYVAKLPVTVKKLLYPGLVSKSWLMTVNTLHSFPHALALLSYLMDLNKRIHIECDEWLFQQSDEITYLKQMYLRETWKIFQVSNDFDQVRNDYIKQLMNLLDVSDERRSKLQEEISSMQARLGSPRIVAGRMSEQQKLSTLNRVKTSLKDMQAECANQTSHNNGMKQLLSEQELKLEQVSQEVSHLKVNLDAIKEKLATQTMGIKERNKLLDDVDYSNRVMDSKLSMIAGLEKKLNELNLELSRSQNNTMVYCVTFNEKLISLENADEKTGDVNQFIIEQRDLMEPATMSRLDKALDWLENRKLEIAERIKKSEVDKFAAMRRKSANVGEVEKLAKQLEQVRQARMEDEKKRQQSRKRNIALIEDLEGRIALSRKNAQSRTKQAVLTEAKLDGELNQWSREVSQWTQKLAQLEEQAEKHRLYCSNFVQTAKEKRKAKTLSMIQGWTKML